MSFGFGWFLCGFVFVFFPDPVIKLVRDTNFYPVLFLQALENYSFWVHGNCRFNIWRTKFLFEYFCVIIKASIVELRSISSVSLLNRHLPVLCPFIGKTVLGASTTFSRTTHGHLAICVFLLTSLIVMYPPCWKDDWSYFPQHPLFCFLLLIFANNLLIFFWFFVFLAVMRSVGEFSVSESSVERVSVLWVVLFFFSFLWQRSGVFWSVQGFLMSCIMASLIVL